MSRDDRDDDPHRDLRGVLHDVSNALTVVLGWVSEARAEGTSPERVAQALELAEESARVAKGMARRAIGGAWAPREARALEVCQRVVRALGVEASRHDVRIVCDGVDDEKLLRAADDAEQVLINLVLNALAHAPTDSVIRVTVSVPEKDVVIDVVDQGPGVDEGRRISIFEGETTRPGGSGNGLRHARALARAAGGNLLLLQEGAGAHFRLVWPPAGGSVPRARVAGRPSAVLEGKRVLVLDDDVAITDLLETSLEAKGAEVCVVRTKGELERALPSGHDAALVDLSPIAADVEGSVRAVLGAVPRVVVVTGSADSVPEALSAAGVLVVRKPFELHEIVEVLTRRTSA
ncbi:MAG: hypothetical protein JNL38_11905 [Myxococcales bacterium]|nr:hypothetical protein [Myxococcales bacterium]